MNTPPRHSVCCTAASLVPGLWCRAVVLILIGMGTGLAASGEVVVPKPRPAERFDEALQAFDQVKLREAFEGAAAARDVHMTHLQEGTSRTGEAQLVGLEEAIQNCIREALRHSTSLDQVRDSSKGAFRWQEMPKQLTVGKRDPETLAEDRDAIPGLEGCRWTSLAEVPGSGKPIVLHQQVRSVSGKRVWVFQHSATIALNRGRFRRIHEQDPYAVVCLGERVWFGDISHWNDEPDGGPYFYGMGLLALDVFFDGDEVPHSVMVHGPTGNWGYVRLFVYAFVEARERWECVFRVDKEHGDWYRYDADASVLYVGRHNPTNDGGTWEEKVDVRGLLARAAASRAKQAER